MHEVGLVSTALSELLERTNGQPVRAVRLALGPGAEREVIEAVWAQAVAGTAADGAVVEWVEARDELVCFDCGRLYAARRLDPCPACGGNGLVVGPAPDITIEDWHPVQ